MSTKSLNKAKGAKGEAIAYNHLTNNGYTILETNYKTKFGEIDIIATKGTYTVFIEVKYRTTTAYGTPKEAVNYPKMQKIQRVATAYIQKKALHNSYFRFDVIEVTENNGIAINHIENAFTM